MESNVVDLQKLKLGKLLRHWRTQRRLTQMEFAGNAEISTKHLSFLETGRAQPSREMVLRLAELLEVPLRERNSLLTAAGFAPIFPERPLDDPALTMARQAIDMVLKGHEPFPAVAVDRHWNLVAANATAGLFTADIDPSLLQDPVNVFRISLHPLGIAPKIVNFADWRRHSLSRLRQQVWISSDPVLEQLYKEVAAYRLPDGHASAGESLHDDSHPGAADFVVPMKVKTAHGVLSFFSTVTMFGTPVEITLSELAIESFYPADAETAGALRALQAKSTPPD